MAGRGDRRRALFGAPGAGPFAASVLDYAHNLLVGTALRRLDAPALKRVASSDLLLQLAGASGGDDAENDVAPLRAGLRDYLQRQGRAPRTPRALEPPLDGNLATLGEVLGLDAPQAEILRFLVALNANAGLKELSCVFGELTFSDAGALVAAATALPVERVLRALDPRGRLLASGLVSVDEHDTFQLAGKIELKRGVLDPLLTPGLDRDGLVARFLPEAAAPDLAWDDFEHVRDAGRIARELLGAGLRDARPGVNLLLHGPTGTGKTALARLLAREAGAALYTAGRGDAQGESASARERLSSLLLGQRLVPRRRALLLFDELEDLFPDPLQAMLVGEARSAAMSKQWFNHLLETNPVPTIWITNRVHGIDPAFLRRFSYAMELPPLGPRQRARVLGRHLGSAHDLEASDVEAIAARFHASPAQLGGAVATARLLAADGRPDRGAIERVLAPTEKLLTGADPLRRQVFDAARHHVEILNSPDDLVAIADRLAGWKAGGAGISLCLHGPPGTGKSEYAHYLAHRMGRPVVPCRASDILSKWVGEAEQRIAEAFSRAEREDALLLFDEADTFLRERRGAEHSWEASLVNEFLQQLEDCRGVVACTTNLRDELDAASLRRFVFKLEFRYLAPDQALALFRSAFADLLAAPLAAPDEAPLRSALARFDRLAPGDFAIVARRQRALGRRASPAELVAALRAELAAKPGAQRAVGF